MTNTGVGRLFLFSINEVGRAESIYTNWTELLLYKHALEYMYMSTNIQYVPCIYCFIPGSYQGRTSTYWNLMSIQQVDCCELKKVMAMLQCPDFSSKETDPDLHKQMTQALDDDLPFYMGQLRYKPWHAQFILVCTWYIPLHSLYIPADKYGVDTQLWHFGRV